MNLIKSFFRAQFKALGNRGVPSSIMIDGEVYYFLETIKHSFAVAVAVYDLGGRKMVVKLHRQAGFFGIPLKWVGELMAGYENAVLRHCSDISGVPRQRGCELKTAVAHDYLKGRSLRTYESVDDAFFHRLFEVLEQIHARGVACVDLEKPENILKGEDGCPYFLDFQVAFFWPDRLPPGNCSLIRFIREWLQRCDRYHAYKHLKRMRPDLLSGQRHETELSKPWPVNVANALLIPWQMMRKIFQKIAREWK